MSSERPATLRQSAESGHRPDQGRWPRITVVTPSFEQARFLEATMRSVLEQGYPNLEYIVVDGGSSDGSRTLMRRYEQELSFWISEPDRGQAHAINKGFARSTGEIMGWLNSDDLLLPGSLFRIARAFRRHPSTAAVAGLRQRIDSAGRFLGNWLRDLPTKDHLSHYCCLAQETVYWRRVVWEKVGPLDETLHYALDYEYWLRILSSGFAFSWIPSYLGAFREHPESKTSLSEKIFRRDIKEIYRRFDLGRNEEEVLAGMGEYWPQRLALLEDLGRSSWSRSPRLVTLLLRSLENPRLHDALTTLYRHYRFLRPRGQTHPSRGSALASAGWRTALARPVGDRRDPYLLPSDPLNRPRVCEGDWADNLPALGPADTLRVGAGWSWVEHSPDHVYRWAENDAEIVVLRPSGRRSELLIDLETGPALAWQPFELTILDESNQVLLEKKVEPRETLALRLPLNAGRDAQVFRLCVSDGGGPAGPADSRILRFRATRIRWADEEARYDLPMARGRVAEIVLEAPDVVPIAPVEVLLNTPTPGALRTPALFLGRGWSRRDPATGCRHAFPGAELVVLEGGGQELEMTLRSGERPGLCHLESNHHKRIEGQIGKVAEVLRFALPDSLPSPHLLRLAFTPQNGAPSSIASVRWAPIP